MKGYIHGSDICIIKEIHDFVNYERLYVYIHDLCFSSTIYDNYSEDMRE